MSDRMAEAMLRKIDKAIAELREQATNTLLDDRQYVKVVGKVEGLRAARLLVEDEKRNFFHRDDLE